MGNGSMSMLVNERKALFALAVRPPVGMFLEDIIRGIYTDILRPGDIAVDCGASWGTHTIPMSEAVGRNGRVIAIEAIPELAAHLMRWAHDRGNMDVVGKALGSSEGRARFHVVADDSGYSGLRKRDDLPAEFSKGVTTIEVPVTTLDQIFASYKPVRFMKMDLEGGEYHALCGAFSSIQKDRPFIVFESGRESTAQLYGYSRNDFFDLFARLGLSLFDLFGDPFGPDDWLAEGIPWNFIAVGRGSPDEGFIARRLPDLIAAIALDNSNRA
jgi:FkbM family methyltransferase